jgi:hypothetical protein
MDAAFQDLCRQLERELDDKTNEVARLMELLERAIEIADEAIIPLQRSEYSMDGDMLYRQLERLRDEVAQLAPAPEEQTLCLREPTAEESKVLDKIIDELRKEDRHYAPIWRELGPDEVIQEGDEYTWGEYWHDVDLSVTDTPSSYPNFSFRTRRPLPTTNCKQISSKLVDGPKQKGMPMEKELDYLTHEASRASDIHNHVLIVDCLRYLRDEIQKLKNETHYHHESYCRKCKQPK